MKFDCHPTSGSLGLTQDYLIIIVFILAYLSSTVAFIYSFAVSYSRAKRATREPIGEDLYLINLVIDPRHRTILLSTSSETATLKCLPLIHQHRIHPTSSSMSPTSALISQEVSHRPPVTVICSNYSSLPRKFQLNPDHRDFISMFRASLNWVTSFGNMNHQSPKTLIGSQSNLTRRASFNLNSSQQLQIPPSSMGGLHQSSQSLFHHSDGISSLKSGSSGSSDDINLFDKFIHAARSQFHELQLESPQDLGTLYLQPIGNCLILVSTVNEDEQNRFTRSGLYRFGPLHLAQPFFKLVLNSVLSPLGIPMFSLTSTPTESSKFSSSSLTPSKSGILTPMQAPSSRSMNNLPRHTQTPGGSPSASPASALTSAPIPYHTQFLPSESVLMPGLHGGRVISPTQFIGCLIDYSRRISIRRRHLISTQDIDDLSEGDDDNDTKPFFSNLLSCFSSSPSSSPSHPLTLSLESEFDRIAVSLIYFRVSNDTTHLMINTRDYFSLPLHRLISTGTDCFDAHALLGWLQECKSQLGAQKLSSWPQSPPIRNLPQSLWKSFILSTSKLAEYLTTDFDLHFGNLYTQQPIIINRTLIIPFVSSTLLPSRVFPSNYQTVASTRLQFLPLRWYTEMMGLRHNCQPIDWPVVLLRTQLAPRQPVSVSSSPEPSPSHRKELGIGDSAVPIETSPSSNSQSVQIFPYAAHLTVDIESMSHPAMRSPPSAATAAGTSELPSPVSGNLAVVSFNQPSSVKPTLHLHSIMHGA